MTKPEFSHIDKYRIDSKVNKINQSNSIIDSNRLLVKAEEIAAKLGDKEPFFAQWALLHLPEARVETLAIQAAEKGKIPVKLFTFLVKKELKKLDKTT